MKQKVIIKGPILSRSGYGEQARFALDALRWHEERFDLYILNIPWGQTGQISSSHIRPWIEKTILKTVAYMQSGGTFDISLQVTIPLEFEKIAPVNIGYTAAIETTRMAHEWITKSNETVDKIITVSHHGKQVYENTKYDISNSETGEGIKDWGLDENIPVEVVNYSARCIGDEVPLDIELTTTKNFLVVSQWGPRKNIENTVKWFVEEFKDDEDVGLILKTNTASDSMLDRERTFSVLGRLLKLHTPTDRKCKIYVIHGDISEEQLTWLYRHPTMKALINIAHGEGFGLPLFEAACNGLPLITTTWSGQMDFICKPNKKGKKVPLVAKVDYDLGPIPDHAVWDKILIKESMWAYPREVSYKRVLRETLTKEKHFKTKATSLQKHILKTFTADAKYKEFADIIYTPDAEQEAWLNELEQLEAL